MIWGAVWMFILSGITEGGSICFVKDFLFFKKQPRFEGKKILYQKSPQPSFNREIVCRVSSSFSTHPDMICIFEWLSRNIGFGLGVTLKEEKWMIFLKLFVVVPTLYHAHTKAEPLQAKFKPATLFNLVTWTGEETSEEYNVLNSHMLCLYIVCLLNVSSSAMWYTIFCFSTAGVCRTNHITFTSAVNLCLLYALVMLLFINYIDGCLVSEWKTGFLRTSHDGLWVGFFFFPSPIFMQK